MNMKKRLLILSLSLCLGLGGSLTAYAAEVNPPVAENTENTETADQTETAPAEKTAAQPVEAAAQKEAAPAAENTESTPAAEAATDDTTKAAADDSKKDGSSNTVTTEKPNTDIKVTPSNANALILMDAGAQSPKAAPGQTVEVVLPLAVNREYLPSEKYLLRNITIRLERRQR